MLNNFKIGDEVNLKNTTCKLIDIKAYEYKGGKTKKYILKCNKCGRLISNNAYKNYSNMECIGCSKSTFKKSECDNYWIGITQNEDEFLFSGDDEIVEYIKSCTWRKTTYGYFQNSQGEKLHRVVMGIEKNNEVLVNHIGGNKSDNRVEKLCLSNNIDNSKEKKPSARNSTGIVGLMLRGRKTIKYVGNVKVNGVDIYTPYKERDEALIDLLIVQRELGFKHNSNLFYMLDSVSSERIEEMKVLIDKRLNSINDHNIKTTNRYELSECKTYYIFYDDKEKSFKVSLEHLEEVLKGKWFVTTKGKNTRKLYVQGTIVIDGTRKSVRLHRYLMDLLDVKYKKYFIDHLNGDGLDNRISNLIITDNKGNGINKSGMDDIKGYTFVNGVYKARIFSDGKSLSKTFKVEQEAMDWYNAKVKENMNNRLEFKNRNELDSHLSSITKDDLNKSA